MLMTKFAGKPYAGKPHVRFDEGVRSCNEATPYSTLLANFIECYFLYNGSAPMVPTNSFKYLGDFTWS
jgi:hypothetical protein